MNLLKKSFQPFAAIAFLLLPGVALAHPSHHETATFATGMMHPLLGLDHLLAAAAVGLVAARLGKAWRWALPGIFVGAMFATITVARWAQPMENAEWLVALSLVTLGVWYVAGLRMPMAVAAIVAGFGMAHGYVHASELPGTGGWLPYALGLILTTAIAHALGVKAGIAVNLRVQMAVRIFAALIAAFGAVLLGLGFSS